MRESMTHKDQDQTAPKRKPARARGKKARANGVATRKKVIKTATSMFAAAGYEATSLRQISAGVGIDLATLKYHFGDKANLFAAVYQDGHETFIATVSPLLSNIQDIDTPEDVQGIIVQLVEVLQDVILGQPDFIRMFLYRILEDSSDIIDLEDELQDNAVALIDSAFQNLIERGLIRPIDTRAFVTMLITSMPIWFVTADVKPSWIANPNPTLSAEGRQRSTRFLTDLFARLLVPSP